MTSSRLIHTLDGFLQPLNDLATRWAASIRDLDLTSSTHEANRDSRRVVVDAIPLPPVGGPGELSDLPTLRSAFPRSLTRVTNDELKKQLQERLVRVLGLTLAASSGAICALSDLAYDLAACRSLIAPEDRFDVSASSIFSLASYAWLVSSEQASGKQAIVLRQSGQVAIQLAMQHAEALRPGDLWILDAVARCVCRHVLERPSGNAIGKLAPSFVALSSLFKLLDIGHYPSWVAQQAEFSRWPGMRLVIADTAATAARRLVLGSLGASLGERHDPSCRAFLRLVHHVLQSNDPRDSLPGRRFLASLLWEVLEYDEAALAALASQDLLRDAIQRVVLAIETDRSADRAPGLRSERLRLVEIRNCIRTFATYGQLRKSVSEPNPTQVNLGK